MSILSICSEPGLMNVIRIVVLLINIIKIIIPIVLIVFLVIKIMGAIAKQDSEEITKTVKSSIPNLIAAVLIFLIPTLFDIVARLSFPNSDYAKCISGITKEKIAEIYISTMDDLINRADESGLYSDYANAVTYLSNIKDQSKREEYQKKLQELEEKYNYGKTEIACNNKNNYAKVNYSNFKWTAYQSNKGPANKYYSNILPYGIWAPENVGDLNGVSLPLIVWLHGSGELSYQENMNVNNFIKTAFPKVISDWSKSGLEPIPAIIVAPQAASQWASNANTRDKNIESIKALINYANEVYNIDLRNVVLMGHSIGGNGVIHVAYEMNKKYSKDYFSKLVIFSATYDLKYPSNDVESGHNYFANKEIKGYSENTNCKPFFEWINKPDNFRLIKGVSHGDLPRAAMYLDENNDSVSDIVYWLFGKNEKCDLDGDDNYSPQGDNPAAGITASCIGDYENTIGHARLSVNVMSGNATKYTFINGGATVQTGSINTYYSSNSLEILIHPKVKITSSKGASTTISCMVNHSTYPSYNKKGYYFKVKSNKDKSDSIVSPYNKNRMPYYIHIPENVSPNEKLPLIVGLHGGFGIGTCTSINGNVSVISEGGQTNEYFKNVYWVGKHYNINGGKDNDLKAVILTVSNNRCSWKGDMYSVVEIMRAIIKTYNIDVDKVYVTGVSQGGMGSLYLDFLEESILYKVENGDTTISDIASRYNTTIDEIAKYNKKSDNEISYSNSSQGLLRKDSILLVRPRSQNDPRSIFALVMSFSPAHDSYRYGFVNPEGKTPPNTLKTPLWIITSNDEYTKVQDMAKEMTRYYSKAGDIRYTVLTQINKKPAPDDLYYDEHDTDTCFFNRTSAAKWMINQSYGKVTVSNNSEIDAIEREMGSHFKQVWRP